MRARTQRRASARLAAMPAVISVSSVHRSTGPSLAITGVSSRWSSFSIAWWVSCQAVRTSVRACDPSRSGGTPATLKKTRTHRSPGSICGSSPYCSNATRCTPPSGKCPFTCSSSLLCSPSSAARSMPASFELPRSELGLELIEPAHPLGELRERRPLADAGQGPAHAFRTVGCDARGDQRVERLQLFGSEPGHHRGEFAAAAPGAHPASAAHVHPGLVVVGDVGVIRDDLKLADLRQLFRELAAELHHPRHVLAVPPLPVVLRDEHPN